MIGHVIPPALFERDPDLTKARKLQERIDFYVLEHGHEPSADKIQEFIAILDRLRE